MEPTKLIWSDGELIAWEDATTHVLSHALHYGTAVFEGIRAYAAKEGTAAFRLTDHMKRLHRSAKAVGIPLKWSVEELVDASKQLLRENDLPAAYIRPLVFHAEGAMGINPAKARVRTVIAGWAWGAYLGEDGITNGIRAVVSSWLRIDSRVLLPGAKASGQYLNSVLAKAEALRAGVDEAIMLNAPGHVAEGSGQNLFLVRDGAVTTPPPSVGALRGITRNTVQTLLADAGYSVVEASVPREELYMADEVFMTGTAAEVTPVREIDGRAVGDGRPGPITRKVQEMFASAVRGELSEYLAWVEYV